MRVLVAVIDDLFAFAKQSLFGIHPAVRQSHFTQPYVAPAVVSTPRAIDAAQYFVGVEDARLYTNPAVSFDTTIMRLPYGSSVLLLQFANAWAQVRFGNTSGWVQTDILRERQADVFPKFEEALFYDAQHPDTKKLRAYIGDAFSGEQAGIALTGAEYVTYALLTKKKIIAWNGERPRFAGTWQKKLRGKDSVHIGIQPKAESVMEYVVDDVGYVAFVDAVFADGSIKICGVGLEEEGYYQEQILTQEQYRELHSVFIEVVV